MCSSDKENDSGGEGDHGENNNVENREADNLQLEHKQDKSDEEDEAVS